MIPPLLVFAKFINTTPFTLAGVEQVPIVSKSLEKEDAFSAFLEMAVFVLWLFRYFSKLASGRKTLLVTEVMIDERFIKKVMLV